MIDSIAIEIISFEKSTPVLVCIDGIDGAGKTEFAKKLTRKIKSSGKDVILCSVDNFHNPSEIRYQKGNDSAVGFYKDSYNYSKLKESLLLPFKKGFGKYIDSIFDVDTNKPNKTDSKLIPKNSILIVEGIFLQRPELIKFWDLKIFLDVDFDTSLKRNIKRSRDQKKIGKEDAIISRYERRYMPGQKLYLNESSPKHNADFLINNNDFNNPIIISKKCT